MSTAAFRDVQRADTKFPHCSFIKNRNKNTIYWRDWTARLLGLNISTIPGYHKLNAGTEPCTGGPHIVSIQGIPCRCHWGLQGIHWWLRSCTCHLLDLPPYAVMKRVQIRWVGGPHRGQPEGIKARHCLVSALLLHNLGFVGRCRILLPDDPLPGKVGPHPRSDHHLEHLQVVLCLQPEPSLEPEGFHDVVIWGNNTQHHDTGRMLGPHDGWDIPQVKGQPAVIAVIAGLVHCPGLHVWEEPHSGPIALHPVDQGCSPGHPTHLQCHHQELAFSPDVGLQPKVLVDWVLDCLLITASLLGEGTHGLGWVIGDLTLKGLHEGLRSHQPC